MRISKVTLLFVSVLELVDIDGLTFDLRKLLYRCSFSAPTRGPAKHGACQFKACANAFEEFFEIRCILIVSFSNRRVVLCRHLR